MVWWVFFSLNIFLLFVFGKGESNINYDGRSLIINGQRRILFSGSIHYPRSTPQMWPSLIAKAKEGGIDVIQTYVFWNLHEPQMGQYDFSGRNDLVQFIKEIKAQGLFVCLRIGPFIEAEWNYGGFPFWLHDIPGIVYRSDNEPFKYYMQNFTTKIVNLMKSEGLYGSQGGPIILSQIENEYQNPEAAFKEKGPPYVRWAAKMAVELGTGVPWIMCKQTDAPDPLINTCNGMNCGETFERPNSPNKPKLWTENWTSFYQFFGGEPYIRSAENIAYHTTLFIAKNGSYVNYYMYHGGTNFGRTSATYMITGYYDQAPLDEYGLIRQPKWGHLKEMHAAIKLCSTPLLQGVPTNFSIAQFQQAYVFEEVTGGCVAFLVNTDKINSTVQFRNGSFDLLPKSISILQDCKTLIFNTAKVNVGKNERSTIPSQMFNSVETWNAFGDVVPNFLDTSMSSNSLLEQMNTTKDKSDYLWYTFSFQSSSSCSAPQLYVESHSHVAHAFVNNVYAGVAHGSHDAKMFSMKTPISLNSGVNNVSILSVMVGLPDSGAYLERRFAGLTRLEIQCAEVKASYNFKNYTLGYKVGLLGESLQIYDEKNSGKVQWNSTTLFNNKPLTWYKIAFDEPAGNDSLALNLGSMGKGEAWVNGQSIGRYWVSFYTPNGHPSQTMYHVPRSFLKPVGNFLVLFEELGGDPVHVSLDIISVSNLNGPVSHSHLGR